MAPLPTALHSSQSLQGSGTIALTETKSRDAAGVATPPAGRVGNLRGRDVVVGLVAPHHRVSGRQTLLALSALDALVVGATAYAGASALQAGHADGAQPWEPSLYSLAAGAAGFVAGSALPSLLSRACHAVLCRLEARHLRQQDKSAQALLDDLVSQAIDSGPLTPGGLRACVARIHELRRLRGDELPARAVAEAIARLAPLGHLDLLLEQLSRLHDDGDLSTPSFRRALVSLAGHLPAPAQADERGTHATLERLLRAYQAAHPADGKSSGDAPLWAAADFTVSLCGTPCFALDTQAVRLQAAEMLGCHPRAYGESLPVASQRSRSSAKAQAPISEVMEMVSQATTDQLKHRVGSAIGIALNGARAPVDQARYLLSIVHVLAARTDLPPGAFLEGLLTPHAVRALAQAIVKDNSPLPPGVDKAALIAELPRLCQLQATGKMMAGIVQALRELPQHAPEGGDAAARSARRARLHESVEAAFTAVDARITGIRQDASLRVGSNAWFRLLSSPAASLRHPWLADAGRQALQAIAPPATESDEPAHAVIEVRDFLNAPQADKG